MAFTCPKCNHPIQSDSVYCDICGANLGELMSAETRPYTPPPAGTCECPQCGFANPPRTIFCEYCGEQLKPTDSFDIQPGLTQSPSTSEQRFTETKHGVQGAQVAMDALSEIIEIPGWFLVQPNGERLDIPHKLKEIYIGRDDIVSNVFPDIDLSRFDALKKGVGRKHIRLTLEDKQISIEDLQTVNGTFINGKRLLPHVPVPIQHGDVIVLGKLKLIYQEM